MSNQPNIFKFATSELSQDAFICWLLSYVNHPQDEKLNKCAKEFVALLYNLKSGLAQINSGNVETLENLKQQYYHTDVYFQAVINGRRISFIVEDKTYTSYHSDQLNRYKQQIKNDDIKEDEVVCIYFKTGYLLPWDEKATDCGYAILDYKKIHEFLQKYKTNNLIFESYKKYIKEDFYDYYENNKNRWQKDDCECFTHYFAQLEFMKKLSESCPENVQYNYVGQERICNGKNRDGTPWTELYFSELPDVFNGIAENLFYRLDKRKNPEGGGKPEYYLSIRHYAKVKDNPEAKQKKLERLEKYIKILGEINKSTSLDFSNFRKDNSGANESEIGTLFFDKEKHKPSTVLEQIGEMHKQFVQRIQLTDTIMKS